MCGICGIVSPAGADRGRLEAMSATLVHRGPDSSGVHVDGPVGLAARRLSIIDLETGDQPIANEDGTVVVVQNGELYNYRELRAELEASGSSLPHPRGHGGARPPVRAARHRLRGAPAWDVRGRDLGRAPRPARARARPVRDQAARLPRRRRRARVRVRAARAAARRDRPRRARGVPRVQLDSRAALDLPRRPQAHARPRARLGGRRGHARAVRAARSGARGRRSARGRGGPRRGVARAAARLRPRAPRRGRSRRRPALGRDRLVAAGGACRRGVGRAAPHLLDRLRGELVR